MLPLAAFSQEPGAIKDKFITYFKNLPKEKLYIHTDKPSYFKGDSIWYRVHVVDALMNTPTSLSRYAMVELRSAKSDSLLFRHLLMADSLGVMSDVMPLPETVNPGEYIMSAQTSWMRNFPGEGIFSKKIEITDPYDNVNKQNKKIKDFSISLMPEGGHLVNGLISRVAFKAVGDDGCGAEVQLSVINSKGETILETSSTHKGMGSFIISPAKDEHLKIEARTKDGLKKSVSIEPALDSGVVMSVSKRKQQLLIQLRCTPDILPSSLSLVLYGGTNLYVTDLSSPMVSIPLNMLAPGVLNIAVITKNDSRILSERCVFIRPPHIISAIAEAEGKTFDPKNRVPVDIEIKDAQGKPVKGCFSLSITDSETVMQKEFGITAASAFLLADEIKGYVEDPGYYLSGDTPEINANLDLLMLTQGWRRYDADYILKGKYPEIKHNVQKFQSIEGKVSGNWIKKVNEAKLLLMCPKKKFMKVFDLGENLSFKFDNLKFEDGTEFILEAMDKKSSTRNMSLSIEEDTDWNMISAVPGHAQSYKDTDGITQKANEVRISYLDGMKLIELPDIEIKAKRKENQAMNKYGVQPDRAMDEGNDYLNSPTIDLALQSLGVKLTYKDGLQHINAKVYVDDIKLEEDEIWQIMPSEVKRIEYLRPENPMSMTYGFDAANKGLVMIYLKDESSFKASGKPIDALKAITPLGYRPSISFYSPDYSKPAKPGETILPDMRTTLFWTPSLVTDSEGKAHLQIFTPERACKIHIDVQGVSDNGAIVSTLPE